MLRGLCLSLAIFIGCLVRPPLVARPCRWRLQRSVRAAEAAKISRPAGKVTPEVDQTGVEGTQLLRQVEPEPIRLERCQVLLFVGRDDNRRLAPAVVPERLEGPARDAVRPAADGVRPHPRLAFTDRDHPAEMDALRHHDGADLRGKLAAVVEGLTGE